jgi:N6-L-threonylcarbamoyladenine synthase
LTRSAGCWGCPTPAARPSRRPPATGNPEAFRLPRAWLPGTYDFSFSGLKTAVLHAVQKYTPRDNLRPGDASRASSRQAVPVADLAASFQAAVVDVLVQKACQAAEESGARTLLLAGRRGGQ